jgi:hypothetical protein
MAEIRRIAFPIAGIAIRDYEYDHYVEPGILGVGQGLSRQDSDGSDSRQDHTSCNDSEHERTELPQNVELRELYTQGGCLL